jgi:hypothetical protein
MQRVLFCSGPTPVKPNHASIIRQKPTKKTTEHKQLPNLPPQIPANYGNSHVLGMGFDRGFNQFGLGKGILSIMMNGCTFCTQESILFQGDKSCQPSPMPPRPASLA